MAGLAFWRAAPKAIRAATAGRQLRRNSIAIGSLLDGVPESVVLGTGLLAGGGVSPAMFAAIFLSNLPEGLSSATGMGKAGRSKAFVFGL